MRIAIVPALALLALATTTARAARPEIERPIAAAQALGVVHTVRALPEACARLQGVFTGDAARYRLAPVRTSPTCQPRARLVDPDKARPSTASGWILNDVVRIPSKECAGQVAVIEVWRKPGQAQPPKLDAQGRARIYLQESKENAAAGRMAEITQFSATMRVDGSACG